MVYRRILVLLLVVTLVGAFIQMSAPVQAVNVQHSVAPFHLADGKLDIVTIYVYPADKAPGNVPLDYHSKIYGTQFPMLGAWLSELHTTFGAQSTVPGIGAPEAGGLVPALGRTRSTGWYRLPKKLDAYYANAELNSGLLFNDALQSAKADVRFSDYDAFVVQAWGIGNSMGGRLDNYQLPNGERRNILMAILAEYPDMRDLGTVAHEVLGHALFGWPHSGVLGANSVYTNPDDVMSGACQQGPGVVPNHPVYGCYATMTTSYNLYLSGILPVANVQVIYAGQGQAQAHAQEAELAPQPFALQCLYSPLGAQPKALWLQAGLDDFWLEARCPQSSPFEAWLSGQGVRVYQLMPGEGYLGQSEAKLVVPDPHNPRASEGWYKPGNAFDQVYSHPMVDSHIRVCITSFAGDTYYGWVWHGPAGGVVPGCIVE